MASTNCYTSFTITQPFLGAPLQFQPALGSQELEDLIDLYVTGSASKQSKLSEITIDFYNNATVDLNTGALTRTYNVLSQWSATTATFEQSPACQSSVFSPVFTTSPGSSANFGDSAYGSFSMTPPTHSRGRVTKKPRKETKKDAEIRLPGFSIMTKDGIDVTTSAGRGTKTKEQREHAHLMRIMKACPDCKKKKIRCDPAHKRSAEMSRTSTSTKSSSAPPKPSPPSSSSMSSIPSLTPQTSYASGSTPSFSPSNPIGDFVLFPEDAWTTEVSFAGLDTQDLSQFSFDINALDQFPIDDPFDFPDPQLSNFNWDNNNFGHTPQLVDQYGLDQWASSIGGNDMPVQHTRPHPSSPSTDSGQLSNVPVSWEQSPFISPMDTSTSGFFNDGLLRSRPVAQNVTDNDSPLSSSSDWSILEASLNVQSQGQSSTASLSQSDGSQRQSRKRPASDDSTGFTQSLLPPANQPGSDSGIEVDPSDQPGGVDQPSLSSHRSQLLSQRRGVLALPSSEVRQRSSESPTPIGTPPFAVFVDACQSTSNVLAKLSSPQAANLGTELERLQAVLVQVQSDGITNLPRPVLAQVQTLASQLELVSTRAREVLSKSPNHQRYNKLDPELCPDYLRECQIQVRRIVRSLCATINAVQAQNTGTSSSIDGPILTSGRNVHLFASESGTQTHRSPTSLESGLQMWVESTSQWQHSSSSSSGSSLNRTLGVLLDSPATIASTVFNDDAGRTRYRSPLEATSGMESGSDGRHSLVANEALSDSPRTSATADNQQSLVQSQSHDSANVPLLAVQRDSSFQVHRYRSYAQAESTTTSSNDAIDSVKSTDPAVGGSHLKILQVRRSENATSNVSSNVSSNAGLSQNRYPQDTSLLLESSSAILPSTVVDGQTSSLVAYQLVLTLLATLFASYIASCGYTSLSPCLQVLVPFTLSYLLPLPPSTSTTTSFLNFATVVVVALASTPLLNNLDSIRQAASQWIGTDPMIAIVKFTLCAVLTAQLPNFIGRSTDSFAQMGLAAMAFLSQFDSQSCQSVGLLNTHSSSEVPCSSSRERSSVPSWLVAMRELSLVGVV